MAKKKLQKVYKSNFFIVLLLLFIIIYYIFFIKKTKHGHVALWEVRVDWWHYANKTHFVNHYI